MSVEPPARYRSPYAPEPHCRHPALIERTPDWKRPNAPFGEIVLQVRDWECLTCGACPIDPHGRQLHFKNGHVAPGHGAFVSSY